MWIGIAKVTIELSYPLEITKSTTIDTAELMVRDAVIAEVNKLFKGCPERVISLHILTGKLSQQ